jgi:hypothetical protein
VSELVTDGDLLVAVLKPGSVSQWSRRTERDATGRLVVAAGRETTNATGRLDGGQDARRASEQAWMEMESIWW